jgi:hypothetical protein
MLLVDIDLDKKSDKLWDAKLTPAKKSPKGVLVLELDEFVRPKDPGEKRGGNVVTTSYIAPYPGTEGAYQTIIVRDKFGRERRRAPVK